MSDGDTKSMSAGASDPTLPAEPGDGSGAPPIGTRIARFTMVRAIGAGGMGIVVEAHDPELDRRIAIKLVRPALARGDSGGSSGSRLQREAQAMAKLAHPNVVAVFDAGRWNDQTFIAMELVEGATLRQWQHATRPWREVVRMYIAAGRGLAAAHDAALVHRDFKPDNVLVGGDGRPRVGDFGLVSGERGAASAPTGPLQAPMTVDGAAVGTPAYMSPEHWAGEGVDARSDQFSFCVALWEALWRQRPFGGDTTAALRDAVTAGRVTPPPADAKLPAWLEAALRRGLSRDPAARWPSVAALLAELERRLVPPRRAPWIAAGAGVVAVGAVIAVVLATRSAAPACPDPRPRLTGVWDAARADEVRRAFVATGHPGAAAAADRFIAALDTRADAWVAMQKEACEATHVRKTASPALLDQRTACLDDRRAELGELASAFAAIDSADAVDEAEAAPRSLHPLEDCADLDALADSTLPSDPAARAKVAEIYRVAAASRARSYVGDFDGAFRLGSQALALAREIDDSRALTAALHAAGLAEKNRHDWKPAAEHIREAATVAAAMNRFDEATLRYSELIWILAEGLDDVDGALALRPVAESTLLRAGTPPRAEAELGESIGAALARAGDSAGALAAFERTVEIMRTKLSSDSDVLISALINLAYAHYQREEYDDASKAANEAVAVAEAALGADHPLTSDALQVQAMVLKAQGNLDAAQPLVERALAIRRARYGPDDDRTQQSELTFANLARERGDLARARELYQEHLEALSRSRGANDRDLAVALWALGGVIAEQGDHAAAEPYFTRALTTAESSAGPDSVDYMKIESDYAESLRATGRCRDAVPRYEHVVAIVSKEFPRYAPQFMGALAQCHLDLGDKKQAHAVARRAADACGPQCPPELATQLADLIAAAR